jgi:transposase
MQLESIARSQSLPAALSRRAQMILRLADGETNSAVARRYRVSRPTVSLWRKRFAEHGIAGLHNELKPGRPRSTGEDEIAKLIHTALTRKPSGKTHWSRRSLADETGLSKSTVHRYLTLFGLQPHRSKSFKLSNDPFFIEKVRDIVGLYLNPPDHALVLCVDEKSQCQALERTQPVLPMGLGYVEGITHDYVRHGTTTLFAALDVANGSVLTQCKPKHRHQEFLAFLRHIDANLICDNDGTHRGDAQARSSDGLAGTPAALPSALHADLQFVAEPGRALVRVDHDPGHSPRLVRFGGRPQAQDR